MTSFISLDGPDDSNDSANCLPCGMVIMVVDVPSAVGIFDSLHWVSPHIDVTALSISGDEVSVGVFASKHALVECPLSIGCIARGVACSRARSSRSASVIASVSSGVPCQLLSS
jgi:hypothetical protein